MITPLFLGLSLISQQAQCAPRAAILAALSQRFAETPRAMGLAGDSSVVMELFTNPKTGTWTITATNANGVTCLIASGLGFETLTQGKPA